MARAACRSGEMRTTFQARPTRSSAPITQAEGSISRRRRPCTAERGKAWWLWCQDSPKEISESHATFVLWSSSGKRRRPKKWHTELMDQVTWWSRNARTRPPHTRPRTAPSTPPWASQPASGRQREGGQRDEREELGDPLHARVLEQVAGVLAVVGLAVGLEEPAGVGVPEALEPGAVTDVRRVRVALLVGVRVVLAVVGHPVEHRPLEGGRAQHGEGVLERLVGLERAVGEQAVVADGDAEPGEHVAHGEDREVGAVHPLVPEQDDGGEHARERNEDAEDVAGALDSRHGPAR